MVAGAYKYQLALQRKRNYIAKRKVTQSTVSPPRCSPGASQGSLGHSVIIQDEIASVRDSVGPEDSVSRATLPRPSFPGEINQIFSDFKDLGCNEKFKYIMERCDVNLMNEVGRFIYKGFQKRKYYKENNTV